MKKEVIGGYGAKPADSLETLFAQSEVLFECCALTPETERIVGANLLAKLPDGAVFVNTARGGLVDELALAAEIRSGRLRAGLDVFANEPLPCDSPLRGLDGLVAIPHVAGNTQQARKAAGDFALMNIQRYLEGKCLEGIVRLEKYDLIT